MKGGLLEGLGGGGELLIAVVFDVVFLPFLTLCV